MKEREMLRSVWRAMMNRCYQPSTYGYSRYGGRGIRICDRWRTFTAFASDMWPRPSLEHSIDRIDNDGNYEPGNCRWATSEEQSRNKCTNRLIQFNGTTKCVTAWARDAGLRPTTLFGRLNARPMSVDALRPAERFHPTERLSFALHRPFLGHPRLTVRMLQVLMIVRKHIAQHGRSPSSMTISEVLGLRGRVGPGKHLRALVAAGYVNSAGTGKACKWEVIDRELPELPAYAAIPSGPTPCGPACGCRGRFLQEPVAGEEFEREGMAQAVLRGLKRARGGQ
jgi:hypothetical protein